MSPHMIRTQKHENLKNPIVLQVDSPSVDNDLDSFEVSKHPQSMHHIRNKHSSSSEN